MAVLYVTEADSVLRKDHDMLVITRQGQQVSRVPLPQVEQVVLLGPVSISTQVLTYFLLNGTECVFCSADGRYLGRLVAEESSFGALRIAQSNKISEPGSQLTLAVPMVYGKLRNQSTLLRRQARTRTPTGPYVQRLDNLSARVGQARSLDQLRGIEGEGSRTYFEGLRLCLKNPMGFTARARRPPPDPVNAMLSFGYTLLAQATRSSVFTAGLDPFLGCLHTVERSRPSLALDLMEEFRPILVDSVILRLVNTAAIRPEHFTMESKEGARLTQPGLRTFPDAYEKRMQTLINHPAGGRIPYRRAIDWQARRLAWAIAGNAEAYVPLTTR